MKILSEGNVFRSPFTLKTATYNLPNSYTSFDRFATVVREFNVDVQRLGVGKDTPLQSRQRHGYIRKLLKLIRSDVRLRFPQRIQHPNERRSLPEVIMQAE